jgi:hypothetical protein
LDGGIGADTNSGLRPDVPFKTLKAAIAACTNEMHDTIVVLDYWQPTGEDWPIVVNKTTVAIIGGFSRTFMGWACIVPPGDTAAFDIQATSHIENLYFSAGASHGCIEFGLVGSGPQRTSIHRCYFGYVAPKYGIYSPNADGAGMGLDIGHCTFEYQIVTNGIYLFNPVSARIHDNVFADCGTAAIYIGQGAYCQLLNNTIACSADTQGYGITLGAGTVGIMVAGNMANFGDTDMAANPYLDGAGAGVNHWMTNYKGITLIQPA